MDLSNHCKKIKTLAQLRYPKYITYLNKIPHVYQVCLISCTTGIWRSPQVRRNLGTSQLHEIWASQVHAIHSQVNSKCTKYKLLSTSTIRFATQNIITFVFHIRGWFLKKITSKKEGSPPLRLDWCYLKKYWNTKFQLIQRHKYSQVSWPKRRETISLPIWHRHHWL